MLDIKRIRADFEGVKAAVERRGKGDFGIGRVMELDEKRREILAEVEALKSKQNAVSREVPKLKKAGEDTTALFAEMKELSAKIKSLDAEVGDVEAELRMALLSVPNTPYKDVQDGLDDSDNEELRKVGTPREFDFEAKAHWDIGEGLDILDFERASKLAGARFTVYKGAGARLERAVIKATDKFQTNRYKNADELLEDLDNIEFVTKVVGNSIFNNASKEIENRRAAVEEDDDFEEPKKKKNKKKKHKFSSRIHNCNQLVIMCI